MEGLPITEPSEGLSHELAMLRNSPSLVTSEMRRINSLDVLMRGHPCKFGVRRTVNQNCTCWTRATAATLVLSRLC
jgi:hypothetical protein